MTATATVTTRPSTSAAGSLRDAITLTGRVLQHWKRRPGSILIGLLFPVLMVLMFGYLFGGAMAVPDGKYMDFLVPGMLTMTMLFGLESMVLAVTADTAKGVTERIRAMPVTTPAILAGRSIADLLNAAVGLAVMVLAGLLVGWTSHRDLLLTLAGFGLLIWLRFAFTWVGIYLGLVLKTPESATGVQLLVWPVGFLSSAFVSPETMPGWLGAASTWNPLSATATAIRELFGNPNWHAQNWATEHSITLALIWPAVLTVIFLPLAARQYRVLGR
ncbi:ABC transporter permease [Actinobacteria bacterium YIM 96077]|uniref:Transport permease protein n=1 Tax=Phytoactinopolyspora halophila TaxID=1981511 RepID=A0A329QGN6_9ACTN|nr:ABC transporter permease [Phytoactinopolyspora halophila]AYY13099.1 ABC transporter permease [Actinobacteria bacterium YIM 96077]RAW11111.1 ABC transporter permease [Phytoactinopolyspora halophila]